MDVNVMMQMISSVGFPIACTLAMFYLWNKEREEHKAESEKWIQALDNNTKVIEKLMEKFRE